MGQQARDDGGTAPSVLFAHEPLAAAARGGSGVPDYFQDLRLDQVEDAIFSDFGPYELEPFFRHRLADPDEVAYRQEVFEDLDGAKLLESVAGFSEVMAEVRTALAHADDLDQSHQSARWRLDAACDYVRGVQALADTFASAACSSRALRAFHDHLHAYLSSETFARLTEEARTTSEQLDAVTYSIQVKGLRVSVRPYGQEPDYSAQVAATFERFRQGAVKDYRLALRDWRVLDHVEARILERVAQLEPAPFAALHAFARRWSIFVDPVVERFDREIQFYVSFLRWMAPLRSAGLSWCRPTVKDAASSTRVHATYDVALAQKLVAQHAPVVANDVALEGPERILVVSGPNQGGKTTFARTFGQLHHLAAIGCPVPGTDAVIGLCDDIYTHFEREENLASTGGKLEDDLRRVRDILLAATAQSVVVMNEVFTSTTLDDATFLGAKVLERLGALGARGVYVTFVEELAALSPTIVSMVSTVDPNDPSVRTFKVLRLPADGRSYATAIAEKHGLTYDQIRDLLARHGPASLQAGRRNGPTAVPPRTHEVAALGEAGR